eukprot:gene6212-7444_t
MCRGQLLTVLGDAYQRPDWPYAYFPIALAILNFFFSAITVYFWIVKTYRQTVDEWMLGIEYAISGFFMMHYFANMLKSEFALSYVLDIDSGIDLWTIVPVMVQSQLNTWLSWSYIRVYCLYRYFKALMAIGYNPLELSDVTEQMIGSFFKFLTMVTILSGTMFVFEVLGPIKGFEDKFIATEMGDISFMSMFYFMLTTISTVGYGDLSPVTLLGRFLTFICVINGVFFFSVESGRILELQKRESQGGGRYKPVNVTKTSHAVIIGGAVENSSITILSSVLEELCNPSVCGGEEFTPDVVLLGNRDLSVGLRDIISKKSAYMKRVYTLTGTAFEEEDMQRARVKQCAMLFILPNQATADPDKEDQHQILLASAVLKVHPEIPLRLVLLRPESRRLASQFKISRANCYALNEFKSNLLAQSMRCPGITTLLFGLTHYTSEVDPALLKLHTWIPEYTAGTAHQIYGGILIPEYSEQSFTTIVKQVYNETGAVMLAVQSGGRIVTNPGKSTIVVANAVVFLMATSRNQLESILQPGRYPAVLQLDSGHLVVLAVGPYLQQQLVAFIKPLRADYLVVWREIVIVSNYDISEEPFRYPSGMRHLYTLGMGKGVHHINEDPLSFATLHKAFVHEAYKVGEEKMPSMMWVLPMEGELQRLSTWDELVTWCLEDGAIPLALFRKANMSAELKEATKGSKAAKRRSSTTGRRRSSIGLLGALEDTECAYVVNNPPKYTVPVLHTPHSIKQLVGDAVPDATSAGNEEEEEEEELLEQQRPASYVPKGHCSVSSKSVDPNPSLPHVRDPNLLLSKSRRKQKEVFGRQMTWKDPTKRVTRLVFPPDLHPHFVGGCSVALPDIMRFVAHTFHTPGAMELIQALLKP